MTAPSNSPAQPTLHFLCKARLPYGENKSRNVHPSGGFVVASRFGRLAERFGVLALKQRPVLIETVTRLQTGQSADSKCWVNSRQLERIVQAVILINFSTCAIFRDDARVAWRNDSPQATLVGKRSARLLLPSHLREFATSLARIWFRRCRVCQAFFEFSNEAKQSIFLKIGELVKRYW